METMLFITSLETLLSEISFESSSSDFVYRILDILLLTFPFAFIFKQEYIVTENKLFEQGSIMTIDGYIYMKVKIRSSFNG